MSGDGLVRLGIVRPDAALKPAELIVSRLAAEALMPAETSQEGKSTRRNRSVA
ncbi:hypothetical protein [Streptomyces sp. HUAS TT20]|uniref:hypothetical protein n=1 Tax=Streptomyces sp. HUAS TT20 TaxID=3447509 RepID=UPI0021DAAB26|nr:hypothetical protein [Streptomyces sp. HUAS 15-9]UXY29916.1 hypothetical protein N8I87_27390 [Streptomyces sp. HUAS 15-9]